MKSMDTAVTNAEKLHIIRDTFSVHIVLCFFAHADRFKSTSQLNLIARDNLQEVVAQATALVAMTPYKNLISEASGISLETVRKALQFDKVNEKECLSSLWKVYQGLLAKVPKREYSLVKSSDDLPEGPSDADAFNL